MMWSAFCIALLALGFKFHFSHTSHASTIFWSILCDRSPGFFSETSIFFSPMTTVPSSKRTPRWISSSVTGITRPRTSNISLITSIPFSKSHPQISTSAVKRILPILLDPMTHSSHAKLYSKSLRTISVFFARAAIARRISPGGRIPYLSRIAHVVPPLSATDMIAEILKSGFRLSP